MRVSETNTPHKLQNDHVGQESYSFYEIHLVTLCTSFIKLLIRITSFIPGLFSTPLATSIPHGLTFSIAKQHFFHSNHLLKNLKAKFLESNPN